MIRVSVGSTNPVKIDAVREGFQEFFDEVEVIPVSVVSGVSAQPLNKETIDGALRRARECQKKTNAHFGVGIEGGCIDLGNTAYFMGFCAIVDDKGNAHTGTSGWFECPEWIRHDIKNRKELGVVMDELTGRRDVKKQEGAIGVFTRGVVNRKDLYKHGVYMSLVPFLNKELFGV